MLIKPAVWVKRRRIQNVQISEEVFGCDNCGKVIEGHHPDLTVFYKEIDKATKSHEFCCWQCTIDYLPKIEFDYFISLPTLFAKDEDHYKKGFTISDFLAAIGKKKPTPQEVAHELFEIHEHMPEADIMFVSKSLEAKLEKLLPPPGIVYREERLLELFKEWGIPQPDWEANAAAYGF